MSEKTIIAWTDHTFNIAWGCEKVSPGCKNCYADGIATRYGHRLWGPGSARRTFGDKHWSDPLKWDAQAKREGTRKRVFSSSMCDVFDSHPTIAEEREKLWPLIRQTRNLDWQLLTKRPQNITAALPSDWGAGYPNVWLGVSVESIDYAGRVDILREVPAAVRFISYEPALGPLAGIDLTGIDWVIYGGESGPKYRDHDIEWARTMRVACEEAGTAFFFKQSPALYTERGIYLDGELVRNYPQPRAL